MNGFVSYLPKIRKRDVNYFLVIGNKISKFIIGNLSEIGNLKPLEFVNSIFDTG